MSRLVNWSKQSVVNNAAWGKLYELLTGFLLQETGYNLLQETGDKLIVTYIGGVNWSEKVD